MSIAMKQDIKRWTLKAQITPDPSPDPSPVPDIDIFAPEVPGYVQMPHANLEMGYIMLSTLHERVGEQQALSWDGCDTCAARLSKQTWGRMLGRHQKLDGRKRLNFDMNTYGLQIGQDFHIQQNPNNNSRRHSGVYASYAHAKTDFYDENRAVNGIISGDPVRDKPRRSGRGRIARTAQPSLFLGFSVEFAAARCTGARWKSARRRSLKRNRTATTARLSSSASGCRAVPCAAGDWRRL